MTAYLFHYLTSLYLTAATTLGLGIFVLLQREKKALHRIFAWYCFAKAGWSFCQATTVLSKDPAISLIFARLVLVFVPFLGTFFLHFLSCLLEKPFLKRLVRLNYGLCLLSAAAVLHPLFIRGVSFRPYFNGFFADAGPLFKWHVIWFVTLIGFGLTLLWQETHRATGVRKNQLLYVAIGSTLGYLFGLPNYLYNWNHPLPWINPYGTYAVPIYSAMMCYAIIRHHLMDIKIVIRRSILASLVLALLIAGYFGLIYTAERLFKMTLAQHHTLALGLSSITTLALGLIVFSAEPRRRLNRIFGLYSLTIVGWAFSEIFVFNTLNLTTATFWNYYLAWPSVIFIAPTFLHSVFLSLDDNRRSSQLILKISYTLSVFFLVAHFLFPGLLTSPPKAGGSYANFHYAVSTAGRVIPLTFFVLVNFALWILWWSYRKATGHRRTQLKYLFWASVVGYLGGGADWFLVFERMVPILNPFGLYCVPLYSIATTYAVLQHKLFDVNVVIRKSLVYSLLITVLTVGYFGLVYLTERSFQIAFGYHSVWISLIAFAVMALVFQPLKIAVQRIVDWLFFRAPHEEIVRRMERLEQEVRQSEKLKAISTLAAGMAHEIKNPLCAIKTFAEFLPEKGMDPEFQQKFQRIVTKEVDKIDRIVRQVLSFAKPDAPQLRPVQLSRVLDETIDLLSSETVSRRITVERHYDGADTVQADPEQLRQVFLNLFLNSLEAMNGHAYLPRQEGDHEESRRRQGGQLSISTKQDGSNLTVSISDTGCGIPKEQLQRIFDPFFTTKEQGTGLGLSVVQGIIKEHRGSITFDSQPNRGTTCTLRFPLA